MRLTIPSNLITRYAVIAVSAFAAANQGQAAPYAAFVTNEISGEVAVIDGANDTVTATFPVGKRPRGIHVSSDGKRAFVMLSGSPRMAPGVDENRAPADKGADGMGVIDVAVRKVIDKWHVGSDPEQFAISKDGALAFIANEDEASMSIVDLTNGQSRGQVKVSEEPEGVGVNPANGEVYVTCEEKGDVFVVEPISQRVLANIKVGGRPRSVVFTPDGARAFVACENGGYVAVLDARARTLLSKIELPQGSLPMGTAITRHDKTLYVSTGRGNAVAVIDTATSAVAATIPVGKRAWGIALSPDESKLYTANGASNDVSVVDTAARKELKRIPVAGGPWGIAIVPQ